MTDPLRVEKHGITATKAVDTDDNEGVRVTLTIESEWGEPIAVRVRDPVPSAGTVGIPGDQREHCNVCDDEFTYEGVIEPEAIVRAEYEVTGDDLTSANDALQTKPEVGVANVSAAGPETHPHVRSGGVSAYSGPNPGADNGSRIERNADAAVDGTPAEEAVDGTPRSGPPTAPREATNPDARSLFESLDGFSMPEDDDEETAAVLDDDIGPCTLDKSAPDDESDANVHQSTDDGPAGGVSRKNAAEAGAADWQLESSDDLTEATAGGDECAIDHLEDEVVDGYLEWVCTEGTIAEPGRASLEVRVRYLQSQFQELAAYINAMEAFIDEHGSGKQILTALTADMEAVRDRADDIRTTQTTMRGRLETVETSLETLQSQLDAREESVDDSVADLADVVEAVKATQREMGADMEDLKAFRKKLQDAI